MFIKTLDVAFFEEIEGILEGKLEAPKIIKHLIPFHVNASMVYICEF